MTTIGVFAKIFDEQNRILCVKQNYAQYKWTTPGGRLEENENPADCVVREVLEETNIHVKVESLIGTYYADYKHDLVLSFRCKIIKQDPWSPNDEIADRDYFTQDTLPQPMERNTIVRIHDAFSEHKSIYRLFGERSDAKSDMYLIPEIIK